MLRGQKEAHELQDKSLKEGATPRGLQNNKNATHKNVWSVQTFGIHLKDFLAISENFENFHIEFTSQPMLS